MHLQVPLLLSTLELLLHKPLGRKGALVTYAIQMPRQVCVEIYLCKKAIDAFYRAKRLTKF